MTPARSHLLMILPLLAAAVAFWLLLLSPKRQEVSDLEAEAADLRAQVDEQEQLAAQAESARKDFPRAYRRVVLLGKAAPEDADTSSFLVQLDRISRASEVKFISLGSEAGGESASPAAASPQTPAQTATESEQTVENAEQGAASSPPAPTEAQAALLPIGASIGPAGLPVMRYSLSFEGSFFKLADFLAGLDRMVRTSGDGNVRVRGRLVTVDSFDLAPIAEDTGSSALGAEFTITTFLTPADEGVTGGAAPTGPAPATSPQPASSPATAAPTETAATTTP